MRQQHLDPLGVEIGHLIPLDSPAMEQNLDFAAAMCTAQNDWQLAEFVEREPRLRASLVVSKEDPDAAVAEIRRRASDRRFSQILMFPRGREPLGDRRYWPIYEAAESLGLPIGIHANGEGGYPSTPGGHTSYYWEYHFCMTMNGPTALASLILNGVPERFPKLKLVFIEIGFMWVPSMAWRLDKLWRKMKSEVPYLKKPPSEYIRSNFWFTTQPIEEPKNGEDLRTVFDWIGWDRLLFSTDYPHWDFDDPKYAFSFELSDGERQQLMRDNARKVFGH
jgi:predicted TIM-barrel fold metal-dependent hydrolase